MKRTRIPKILQHTLAHLITKNMPIDTFGAMTTITHIQLTPNQGIAKIYVNFLSNHPTHPQQFFLNKLSQEKNNLKKQLGSTLRSTLRSIPELRFYIDNSAQQALAIEQILTTLN